MAVDKKNKPIESATERAEAPTAVNRGPDAARWPRSEWLTPYLLFGLVSILLCAGLIEWRTYMELDIDTIDIVAAASAILIALSVAFKVRSLDRATERPETGATSALFRSNGLLWPLAALALVICALGYESYRHDAKRIQGLAMAQLSGVVDLKASELRAWLLQRRRDAGLLLHDPHFADDFAHAVSSAQQAERERFAAHHLDAFVRDFGYKAAFAIDQRGGLIAVAGPAPDAQSLPSARAREALDPQRVTVSELRRDRARNGTELVVDVLLPLKDPHLRAVLGLIVLRYPMDQFLASVLGKLPMSSASAELVLQWHEGGQAVFLAAGPRRTGATLTLQHSPDLKLLSRAQAQGAQAAIEATDFRGVPVLAAVRSIPGTDWQLLAKMDKAEAMRDASSHASLTFGLVFVLLASAAGMVAVHWRHQRRACEQGLHLARLERQALARHFDYSVEYARDIVLLLDESGRVIECNDAATAAYGYARDELLRLDARALRAPAARDALCADLARAAQTRGHTYETQHQRKDGSIFPVESSARRIDIEKRCFYQCIVRDISARKLTERRIGRLTCLYATLSQTNQAIVRATEERSLFDDICRIAVEHGGLSGAAVRIVDAAGESLEPVAISPNMGSVVKAIRLACSADSADAHRPTATAYRENRVCICDDIMAQGAAEPWQEVVRVAGVRSVAALPLARDGQRTGVLTFYAAEAGFFDTEERALLQEMAADLSYTLSNFERERRRKEAESALAESEKQFRGLVEQSIAGIFIVEGGRLNYVNPRFAEIFGYRADEMMQRDFLDFVAVEDRTDVQRNMRLRLLGAVPLAQESFRGVRKDGAVITVGAHGTATSIDGRPALVGIAQDISEREQAKRQIEAHMAQLEEAMLATIRAVSAMVELRDPYTSGHQRRVGALARAIGAELGLDEKICRGLEIMGAVHDIGKISVPAEMLSKPARLSGAEFTIIQVHPQLGYEIIKNVNFPWPVAAAVLQHHERLDGSGYPNGLRGEQIILEARILTVADVVESMSSHRPYRASLGLEMALEEISRHRNARYDAKVVDACIRLFRDKAYELLQ